MKALLEWMAAGNWLKTHRRCQEIPLGHPFRWRKITKAKKKRSRKKKINPPSKIESKSNQLLQQKKNQPSTVQAAKKSRKVAERKATLYDSWNTLVLGKIHWKPGTVWSESREKSVENPVKSGNRTRKRAPSKIDGSGTRWRNWNGAPHCGCRHMAAWFISVLIISSYQIQLYGTPPLRCFFLLVSSSKQLNSFGDSRSYWRSWNPLKPSKTQ